MNLYRQLRYFGMWSGWIREPRLVDIEDHLIQRITPPMEWGMHYRDVQAKLINAGLKVGDTNFDDVRFFTASLIPKRLINFVCSPQYRMNESQTIWGLTFIKDKSIIFLQEALDKLNDDGDIILVRHECTHMIRGVGGHEPEYFNMDFNNIWHYDKPIFNENVK